MTPRRLALIIAAVLVVSGLALGGWYVHVSGGLPWTADSKAYQLLRQARQAALREQRETARGHLTTLFARYPATTWTAEALWLNGELLERDGELLRAREAYQRIVTDFPHRPFAPQAQTAVERVNVAVFCSPTITEEDQSYFVQPGDSLGAIARRFGTTVELLKCANHLTSNLIRPQQQLKVVGGRFSILVDKSENTLVLKQNEAVIKQYVVATGDRNSTPVGTFTIVNRLVDPPWYTAKGLIPAGSPENILGSRWLGLDKPGYGIHGTTDPMSLGKQSTAGCVRMLNADVEELFVIVPAGTPVTIND